MRRSLFTTLALLVPVALAVAGMSLAAAPRQAVRARVEHVPRFGHVFLLIGENTSLSQDDRKNTPYLVKRLKPHSAWLTNYFAVANGSLANYIAMTSGHFKRCEVNDDLPYHLNSGKLLCHERVDNLFHQLDRAHVSWTEWNESMPNPCAFFDTGVDWYSDVYTTHHNPAVYYDDIEGARYNEAFHHAPKAECVHKVLPTGTTRPNDMSTFNHALTTGHISRFSMVIPNDCQNGHDPCATHDPFRQFDVFLRQEVPRIEASPAFGSNGLILITYDDPSGSARKERVLLAALGPQVHPGVYRRGPYSHYSLLRTLEDGFGVPRHLRHAAKARPINQIWK
jgi:hypothetical protein